MTCRAPVSLSWRSTKVGPVLQLLGVLLLFALVRPVMAAQSPACVPSSSAASITLPATGISPGQNNGLIGSPASVSVTFDCSKPFLNDTNFEDDFTLMTGNLAPMDALSVPPSGSGGIMFTTNLPGIEVQLTAAQLQASGGNNGPNGAPGWQMGAIDCISFTLTSSSWQCTPANTLVVTFTAQLVKTGSVTPVIGTVNRINLLQFFDQDTYTRYKCNKSGCFITNPTNASPVNIGTLTLNPVTVSVTACSVAIDPTVVTLPTIATSALTGAGSTTGKQPFSVQLSCPGGANLSITLATANPQTGTTGVIAPTTGSGYAQNVGVQLLRSDGATPVAFGTAIAEGTTANGMISLPFYAQYYQTGASTSAGNVTATATYTLTYQ